MADIVNLRHFKKAKIKSEKSAKADANRIKFGRSKSEKQLEKKQRELALKNLDAHQREDG